MLTLIRSGWFTLSVFCSLAAVFLIFWVFSFTGKMVKGKAIEFEFWFYGALASTMIYIVLKIVKKQKLLDEINR